jgi:hypothetical protein
MLTITLKTLIIFLCLGPFTTHSSPINLRRSSFGWPYDHSSYLVQHGLHYTKFSYKIPSELPKDKIEVDFPNFLSMAQGTSTPFLLLFSGQKEYDAKGATGAASSATVNGQDLIFKRFHLKSGWQWALAMNELMILQHPALRKSEYIIDLKGITFELRMTEPDDSPDDGKKEAYYDVDVPMEPVLILEKAPLGSLWDFMNYNDKKLGE